jgi:hypothetical protein
VEDHKHQVGPLRGKRLAAAGLTRLDYLFLIEITVIIKYLADPRRRIQENFAEQARRLERNFQNMPEIDSRVNVRIDTQPPGNGSEPHLDFIVTDLDGMLAQLLGPGAFGVRRRFSGSEIADQFRGVDLACFCPSRRVKPPDGAG